MVSYDDIATPQNNTSTQLGPPLPSASQPPAKKRRTSNQKAPRGHAPQHVQHWDDPENNAEVMSYDDDAAGEADYDEEEESRDLTHEEIWDDSALIDAWNSATAEYEAYHGKGKNWKEEPIKKSPLWYNVQPIGKKTNGHALTTPATGVPAENDSKPQNFDTYVPTHDPTLVSASAAPALVPESEFAQYMSSASSGSHCTQDEAFSRALSATYWAGYWTAVYHCRQRNQQGQSVDDVEEDNAEADGQDAAAEDEDMADLISAQR